MFSFRDLPLYSLLWQNKSFLWLRTSSFSTLYWVIPLYTVFSSFCSVIITHTNGCLAPSPLLGSLVPLLPHLRGRIVHFPPCRQIILVTSSCFFQTPCLAFLHRLPTGSLAHSMTLTGYQVLRVFISGGMSAVPASGNAGDVWMVWIPEFAASCARPGLVVSLQ